MKTLRLIGFIWLVGALTSAAATWHVATNGVDNSDPGRGESWDLPFATISNAVAKAAHSHTVLVSNGIYAITAHITVNKNIIVRSVDDNPTNTIVDAGGLCRGFYINQVTNATLSGFTVQNGYGATRGGGVYVNVATAVVQNCIFKANLAVDAGGGMYIQYGLVTNCQFIANTNARASHSSYLGGGGLMALDTHVVDSIISSNTSSSSGGGAFIRGTTQLDRCTIEYNTSTDATSSSGGGVHLYGASTLMTNCTVRGNTSSRSGGGVGIGNLGGTIVTHTRIIANTAMLGGGCSWLGSGGILRDCVLSNNTAGSGGGVYSRYVTNIIQRCDLLDNEANNGGGVFTTDGSLSIIQSRIQGNTAGDRGGGIHMTTGPGHLIRNCLVYSNTAQQAGGIYIGNRSNLIENCTIVYNVALTNVAAVGGLWCNYHDDSHVINTIIYHNTADHYPNWRRLLSDVTFSNNCAIPTLAAFGGGNITNDPALIAPEAGNCRLQRGSPCITTGLYLGWMTDATDLDGHLRIDRFSGMVDIGCYEYISAGTMFYYK